ncbi:putative high mobility group protein B1-like 1 [Salminus brasiliensis]|uniref:putative high mobility group protein B1-like 1 n=1 Tax=Salminus brasiliensis TaxID=930266 RepID=UPI003B8347B5
MGKAKDLSDFDKGQIVMARRLGQSISQTAGLVGCSRCAVVKTYQKWSKEGPPVSRRQGHGRPKLIDEHGEQRLARLVQSHKEATVAEIAEKMNAGHDRKVSEHTVHRSLLRMGLGRRVAKDASRPKGRTSAYAFFVLSCRDELKKKSPSAPVNLGTFSKKCSEDWKALGPTEKKRFEDMAKADKARYDEEMKNYIPPNGSEEKKKTNKEAPSEPKRPLSAFFIFCAEHRNAVKSEYPNLSIAEIAKKLVEMWSKLSIKERSPFEQKAVLLREKQEKNSRPGQAGGSAKDAQTEEEEDDDDEEDDDEEEEEDEDDNE